MTSFCDGSFVKWCAFSVLLCQVLSFPKSSTGDKTLVKNIFSETKRDVSSSGVPAVVPLLKSPIFNPYLMYPPVIPGKPIFYPPLISPNDLLLGRLGKTSSATSPPTKAPPLDASDPTLISAYFKAKKDEFLTKLFERLMNTTETASGKMARSATAGNEVPTDGVTPAMDPSFFLKKKYAFLETLFKTLNATAVPAVVDSAENNDTTTTTTPKPTIVPPDFWFPFPKLLKTPKPPKPTKPPKAKKLLKDALDTILLQSLLFDLGVDPQEAAINKRAAVGTASPKKFKTKKPKGEEPTSELYIPEKVDPSLYSVKASECIDKLFKILNKTDGEELDTFIKPKATAVPVKLWTKPDETEYTSKLDAFLDLLIKSLNATETDPPSAKPEKFEKFKGKPSKKLKRSTFLDELLHRVTTTPAPTTTTQTSLSSDDTAEDSDCKLIKELLKECFFDDKMTTALGESTKSQRSLIFRPFGSGAWIPQYLYAAKMGMYLDKLMDSINTAAATDVESGSSGILKRSVESSAGEDISGLPSKEAAIKLIIAELSVLKDDLIDAFAEGIKAQKDAMPTPKPYGPPGKSFKKPFWGGKVAPTPDPIAPIQKRIDVLNDVFDKLTKVEKTLMFTAEPEYDPKLLTNLTEILELTSSKSKLSPKPTVNPESPAYFLAKTKQYLQDLYGNKAEESKED